MKKSLIFGANFSLFLIFSSFYYFLALSIDYFMWSKYISIFLIIVFAILFYLGFNYSVVSLERTNLLLEQEKTNNKTLYDTHKKIKGGMFFLWHYIFTVYESDPSKMFYFWLSKVWFYSAIIMLLLVYSLF